MQHSYYQKEYWRKSGINEAIVIVLRLSLLKWNE